MYPRVNRTCHNLIRCFGTVPQDYKEGKPDTFYIFSLIFPAVSCDRFRLSVLLGDCQNPEHPTRTENMAGPAPRIDPH
jgi:hypothetical protein